MYVQQFLLVLPQGVCRRVCLQNLVHVLPVYNVVTDCSYEICNIIEQWGLGSGVGVLLVLVLVCVCVYTFVGRTLLLVHVQFV